MLARDVVERGEQLDGAERDVIHRDRGALLEADLDSLRRVRRFERVRGHHEDVFRRLTGRILEDAALVRAVPEVAIGGVGLLGRREDGHPLRLDVGDQVLAALELPLAPGRDDAQLGAEGGVGQLEADLIVALPRAAVGERLGADLLRERDLAGGGEGAGH